MAKGKKRKSKSMTINPNEIGKHVPNEMHMRNFLQGAKIEKPKKGKGSYKRQEKHRKRY